MYLHLIILHVTAAMMMGTISYIHDDDDDVDLVYRV